MPQITYAVPKFSEYVVENGIPGFEIAPKGPEDSYIAIKGSSGTKVAEISLSPSNIHDVTICERSAHEAIVNIATEYEGKFAGKTVRILTTYRELDK